MTRTSALTALSLTAGIACAQPGSGPNWQVFLADHTGDSVVDADDFDVWQSSVGDFDRDGAVSSLDYAIWQQNFGAAGTSPSGSDWFDGPSNGAPLTHDTPLAWGAVANPTQQSAINDPHKKWIPILSTSSGLAGDYSADGLVDASDFNIWRDNVLATVSLDDFLQIAGDYNGDGTVDGDDYAIWRENFGAASRQATLRMISADYTGDGVADSTDYTVWLVGSSIDFVAPIDPRTDRWWTPDSPCTPDMNADGIVDNADIATFVQAFLAGDPTADINGDGFIDNADIQAFVQAFLAGC